MLQLGSWNKKMISMRLTQATLDLLDAIVAKSKAKDPWGREATRTRTAAVERAVAAYAAANGVKAPGLKPAAKRRR